VTPEEVEKSIHRLEDFATVQGAMSARTERNLDRLEGMVEALAVRVDAIGVVVDKLADKVNTLADNQRVMFEALDGLTRAVDRFINDLGQNGHGQ
jgi:hypothetical protein